MEDSVNRNGDLCRWLRFLGILLALGCASTRSSQVPPCPANPSPAPHAWDRMKEVLPGTWIAKTASGAPIHVSYTLVSNDTALVERYGTASGKETLTVYHPDRGGLMLTHYCAQGNQPRLRAGQESADTIVFRFLDATNVLPDQEVMTEMAVRLRGAAFERIETYKQPDGRLERAALAFSRAPSANGSANAEPGQTGHAEHPSVQELGLPELSGSVRALYSVGYEKKAREIQGLLEQGRTFYKSQLGVDVPLRLAVLTRQDWTSATPENPYGMPHVDPDSHIVFLPATSDGVVEKPMLEGKSKAARSFLLDIARLGISYERAAEIAVELIGLHELGHVYTRAFGIKPPARWTSEFLASYFAYAFLMEKRPQDARVWMLMLGGAPGTAPPHHTSLEDFERLYSGVGANDYVWYQAQFIGRGAEVYGGRGLGFLTALRPVFPSSGGPLPNEEVVQRLESLSPGFLAWATRTFRQPSVEAKGK